MASPISDKTIEPKIKEIALEEFLKNGFDNTSIKVICDKVHVTTGSFYKRFKDKEELFEKIVEPIASIFLKKFKDNDFDIDEYENDYDNSIKIVLEMVNYVCDNMNTFKLLISCSHGSKYQNYLDQIVKIQEEKTIQLLKETNINSITELEVHMLLTAEYNALFEVVRHDITKEDAFNKIIKIFNFFAVGWEKIFGIEKEC